MWDHHTYNRVYVAFALLGFILCCIPVPWHLQAWNSGTCLFLFWTGLACLNQAINSLVWNGNVINRAPIWCDISTHITIAISVAVPLASLLINRRLHRMSTVPSSFLEKSDRRRALVLDLAIGLGVPTLFMILYYIPQGHRFDILEDIGCVPTIYSTPVAILLILVPPVLISLISMVYSVFAICALLKKRKTMQEQLSNFADCTTTRYNRLIVLAGLDAFLSTPLTLTFLAMNSKNIPISPWISWADTHYNFSRVQQVPGVLWRGGSAEVLEELSRWLVVFCAFLFFALFGFASEARDNYKKAWRYGLHRCKHFSCFRRSRKDASHRNDLLESIRVMQYVGQHPQGGSSQKELPLFYEKA